MKRNDILLDLVVKEATKLKKFATKKEISKLDITKLDGTHVNYCVYGQLTGDCFSNRAYNLIKKCATKVYEVSPYYGIDRCSLNGKPYEIEKPKLRINHFISPIEQFLFKYKVEPISIKGTRSKYAKKLIAFLKGETDELVF